jgi:signal transduction histidine kinase
VLEVAVVSGEERPPGPASIGTQRMEAVGRLAAGVAHDFNNILTAIAGYAGLLAADLPADDPLQADVGEIRKATERATRLTRQLLAFGRRDAQEPRLLDLREVIGDVLPMLRQLIGEHIDLVTNEAVDLPQVVADPSQLEQVVLNLVLNARDAMPDGGRLVVSLAPIVLDEAFVAIRPGSRLGRHVRLAVEDTGTGMAPDVLSHIFEPYFTTKAAGRGTGLGLSTVYGIVKQSGGYVTAESTVGRGTTVSVYLPAA